MKRSLKASAWALLAFLSLLLIACGPAQGNENEATVEPTQVSIVAESQGGETEAEAATDSIAVPVVGQLQYIEIEAGDGPAPEPGDRVSVHYTGTLEDGSIFDSSANAGAPFEFVLGRGEVIPGWDEGIAKMREGGKATLIVPPNLAYGATGAGGGAIPPNATLTFEVELVAVSKPPVPAAVAEEDYQTLSTGVLYYDIEAGDGETVEEGDRISIHFAAWAQDAGYLTSSRDQGQTVIYTLGADEVFLNDWDDGIIGTKVGTMRQFVISPESGSQAVPPGDNLILEIELLQKMEPILRTEVDEADYITTDSGMRYYDMVEGDGALAELGSTVTVHYTGWLEESESHFDSSREHGEPAEFTLGIGQVIPGWDEGVSGMRVGGIRQVIIPPDLAFGEAGQGRIPPSSTLVFEIELLEVAGS